MVAMRRIRQESPRLSYREAFQDRKTADSFCRTLVRKLSQLPLFRHRVIPAMITSNSGVSKERMSRLAKFMAGVPPKCPAEFCISIPSARALYSSRATPATARFPTQISPHLASAENASKLANFMPGDSRNNASSHADFSPSDLSKQRMSKPSSQEPRTKQ